MNTSLDAMHLKESESVTALAQARRLKSSLKQWYREEMATSVMLK